MENEIENLILRKSARRRIKYERPFALSKEAKVAESEKRLETFHDFYDD